MRQIDARFESIEMDFPGYGKRIMLAVGVPLPGVGVASGNLGLWVPGCVFIAIGGSEKLCHRG